jgi:PAS domain S-box-containing protein
MRRFEQLAKAAADQIRLLRDPMGSFQPKLPTPHEARPDSDNGWRTEETLRDLRLIVDSIPAPVAVTTATGEVEFVNQLTLEYFGKTLDDLKGWSTADAVHPDDLPNVVAVWRQAVETGNRYEVEGRHRRADGVYRWFHVNGFPLRDAEGRIARWCVLQTDIEDRRQAEARRAAILDSALDSIVSVDHDGRITEFNPAAERTFGHRRDDVVGRHLADIIIPPSFREAHRLGFARYLATGDARVIGRRIEMTAIRADGTEFPVELAITRVPLDGPPSFTGYLRDITERKQAEENLRRSEAFLAEGQHLGRIGSFSWRVATDEIIWSEQLYRIFEFDQSIPVTLELIATRVHPEDLPLLSDMIQRVRDAGDNFEYEHRLLMPDRSIKYLHLIAHGIRDKDGQLEYIGAAQDVTQRRLSEEALGKARSELAHVSRVTSLGVLSASIAHEINQPLAAIITNGETSLRWLARAEPDIEKARELTRRVVADARRAAEIIDRIRAMATRRAPEQTLLSLDDIVRESMTFLRHELQSRGISVALDFAPNLPRVVGDRTQLQQVVVNLTVNAVQAMGQSEDARPGILIRTMPGDTEMAYCHVEDSGPGIDPTHLPHLFDSFFTTKDSGMGMGLPISRSIIEAHGGHIRADNDSALGGARFSFALPTNGAD